mgnify:CR=1 FL=1
MPMPSIRHDPPLKLRLAVPLALVCVRLMIATRGVRRVLEGLGYEPAGAPAVPAGLPGGYAGTDPAAAPEAALAIGRLVGGTARFLPGTRRCLVQALATAALLQRRGQEHELVIGARPTGGQLLAHAWVTSGEGIVVGDGPLTSLPALVAFRCGAGRVEPATAEPGAGAFSPDGRAGS